MYINSTYKTYIGHIVEIVSAFKKNHTTSLKNSIIVLTYFLMGYLRIT